MDLCNILITMISVIYWLTPGLAVVMGEAWPSSFFCQQIDIAMQRDNASAILGIISLVRND